MKRSRTVAALLMGGISPILVACGEDTPEATTVFPSVEACAVEMSAADCGTAFATARQEHQATAPRFASREACEAEMGDGACTPADDAQANAQANGQNSGQGSSMGNVFVPALVGFMVGRSLSGGFSQPVYFDRQGYARSGRTQIGTAPVLPPRQDQARQGSSGGVATSSGSYYRPGGANAGKSFSVPTTGRSAGFGSTASSHGFSGS